MQVRKKREISILKESKSNPFLNKDNPFYISEKFSHPLSSSSSVSQLLSSSLLTSCQNNQIKLNLRAQCTHCIKNIAKIEQLSQKSHKNRQQKQNIKKLSTNYHNFENKYNNKNQNTKSNPFQRKKLVYLNLPMNHGDNNNQLKNYNNFNNNEYDYDNERKLNNLLMNNPFRVQLMERESFKQKRSSQKQRDSVHIKVKVKVQEQYNQNQENQLNDNEIHLLPIELHPSYPSQNLTYLANIHSPTSSRRSSLVKRFPSPHQAITSIRNSITQSKSLIPSQNSNKRNIAPTMMDIGSFHRYSSSYGDENQMKSQRQRQKDCKNENIMRQGSRKEFLSYNHNNNNINNKNGEKQQYQRMKYPISIGNSYQKIPYHSRNQSEKRQRQTQIQEQELKIITIKGVKYHLNHVHRHF